MFYGFLCLLVICYCRKKAYQRLITLNNSFLAYKIMVDRLSKGQWGLFVLGLWDVVCSLLCLLQAIRLGENQLVPNGFPYLWPTEEWLVCLSFTSDVFYPCHRLEKKNEAISLLKTKASWTPSTASAALYGSTLVQIQTTTRDGLRFLAGKLQRIMAIFILTHCSVRKA